MEDDKLNGKINDDGEQGIFVIIAGAWECSKVYSKHPKHVRIGDYGNLCVWGEIVVVLGCPYQTKILSAYYIMGTGFRSSCFI